MSEVKYIKIPTGLLKACNDRGIWKDIEFYYKLKTIDISGHFLKKFVTPTIKERFNYSESSIWIKIRKLIDLGLIKRSSTGYRLVKYDTLFQILGYDLTDIEKNGKTRKGTFQITKIKSTNVFHLRDIAAFIDIKNNFRQQVFNVLRNIKSLIPKQKMATGLSEGFRYLDGVFQKTDISKYLMECNESNLAKEYALQSGGNLKSIAPNIDIAITCNHLSNILGYSAQSTGYVIEQRLKALGLINVINRTHTIKLDATRQEFEAMNLGKSYYYCNGSIVKQLPNKIFFTDRLI